MPRLMSKPLVTSLLPVAKNFLLVFLLAAAVLILLYPIFSPGFLVYRDNPVHLAEAYSYVENIRHGGSLLEGWSLDNNAGYPLLLYYPKTGFWLIAAFHFLFSVSVELAYKLIVFLSILLPVIGIFVLLRKDCTTLPAFFCSLLFLAQNNLVHYSLSGMSSNSLATGVLFLFARVLFAFTDDPTHKKAIAAGLLLGLLTLTHLYIMVGGIILWAIVFVVFLICCGKGRRLRSLFLLAVPVVGMLTSSLYTYPFMKSAGWLVPAKGDLPLVSAETVLGNLVWKGDFFSHGKGLVAVANVLGNVAIVLGILFAALGVAYAFDGKKKERGFCVRLVSMLVFIGLSSAVASGMLVPGVGFKAKWLESLGLLRSTKIHGYRFLVLARAGMVYLSAYGLSRLVRDKTLPAIGGLGKFSLARKFQWPVLVPVCAIVFFAANLPFFFYDRPLDEIRRNPFFPARDSALLTTSSKLETAKDLMRVCEWLKKNGDKGNRRVFFQDTLGNALLQWRDIARGQDGDMPLSVVTTEDTVTHFTHLPAISSVFSGIPQFGSWIGGNLYPIEKISLSESGMFFGFPVEEFDDMDLVLKKQYLQRLNIRYLVTCEPRLRMRLTSSRCFAHRASFGAFDLFELQDVFYALHAGGWAYFSLPKRSIPNNKVEVTRFDNSGIDISFENYATKIDLCVAVCDHPFWKATVDGPPAPDAGGSAKDDHAQGKPLRIESDDIGLMKIPLRLKDEKGKLKSLLGRHTLRLRYLPSRGASVPITIVSSILSVVLLLVPPLKRKRTPRKKEETAPAASSTVEASRTDVAEG